MCKRRMESRLSPGLLFATVEEKPIIKERATESKTYTVSERAMGEKKTKLTERGKKR